MNLAHQLSFERPVYELENQLEKLESQPNPSANTSDSIRAMRAQIARLKREIFKNLDPWQIVQVARHPTRPQTLDYLELVFAEFVELHGDRAFHDDRSILTGFAKIEDWKVMFVGHHKGRDLKERNQHNFGMAHPEGYRKALVKMQLAAKFGLPIVCFIDTGGAYPGIGAEERGQAYQIALNLREMSRIRTPIICVVIGEGGSGGALGIGIGDHVAILQYAYYSVISPEGCAGILWKHVKFREDAARALKFTAKDLLSFGVVDEIIPEPLGGAHRNHRLMAATLKSFLVSNLDRLAAMPPDDLLEHRYQRFRRLGVFQEPTAQTATESDADHVADSAAST